MYYDRVSLNTGFDFVCIGVIHQNVLSRCHYVRDIEVRHVPHAATAKASSSL